MGERNQRPRRRRQVERCAPFVFKQCNRPTSAKSRELLVEERWAPTQARAEQQAQARYNGLRRPKHNSLGFRLRSPIDGKWTWRIVFAIAAALAVEDKVRRDHHEASSVTSGQLDEDGSA